MSLAEWWKMKWKGRWVAPGELDAAAELAYDRKMELLREKREKEMKLNSVSIEGVADSTAYIESDGSVTFQLTYEWKEPGDPDKGGYRIRTQNSRVRIYDIALAKSVTVGLERGYLVRIVGYIGLEEIVAEVLGVY